MHDGGDQQAEITRIKKLNSIIRQTRTDASDTTEKLADTQNMKDAHSSVRCDRRPIASVISSRNRQSR